MKRITINVPDGAEADLAYLMGRWDNDQTMTIARSLRRIADQERHTQSGGKLKFVYPDRSEEIVRYLD